MSLHRVPREVRNAWPDGVFAMQVLFYFHGQQEDLWWSESMTFAANCSDTFYWATSDAEDITPENLVILAQCWEDLREITGRNDHLADLFACRIRNMRPQGKAYTVRYDPKIWHLFDECGPERKPDNKPFGNPSARPSE